MKLIGENVRHKIYGVGTVIEQSSTMITVHFSSKDTKFPYPSPDTFKKFLTAENPDVQAAILDEYARAEEEAARKRAEEEARKKAEEERRAEEKRKADEEARAQLGRSRSTERKSYVKQERVPGKRMTFFVFQGSMYEEECRGGYIWAPVANKEGLTQHHWDRLLDVRPGDVIFHGFDGYIQAISTARGECYDCIQPEELRSEDLWEPEGRRVDCEYIQIHHPIKTALVQDDILRFSNVKYSPFNKYGTGNQGYLFELNKELARIFLRETVKRNPLIGDIDYVQELLTEGDDAT